jgi:hypothetical protein
MKARNPTHSVKTRRCTVHPAGASLIRLLALMVLAPLGAEAAPGGYLTTPAELVAIAEKAAKGIEPHRENVDAVLAVAARSWEFSPRTHETCSGADDPAWNDNGGGTSILLAKALAYHLTGDDAHAERAAEILEQIMSEVQTISLDVGQCRLNFGWGTPELVAAADLIEPFWKGRSCVGPSSTVYGEDALETGPCKARFQNWLVKNPYYVVSLSGRHSMSNWGSAATNTMAHVADYLSNRPEVRLVHRNPKQVNGGRDAALSPEKALEAANRLALDRMNGYGVEYGSSSSCDDLGGDQQSGEWPPVKSQITELGIIPEDARRDEFCNVPIYDGSYQNYPQIHLGNNIQQCELMRRRGDESCFQNVEQSDLPEYSFVDRKGVTRKTHLRPGRGSIERAIKAIIVDANTEWRRASALNVAYRYYFQKRRLSGLESWEPFLRRRPRDCSQDLCFGTLSHGFAPGETQPAESPLPEPEPAPEPLGKPGTPYPKVL